LNEKKYWVEVGAKIKGKKEKDFSKPLPLPLSPFPRLVQEVYCFLLKRIALTSKR
jgi:hypothetical protein